MSARKMEQVHWYRPERKSWHQLTVRKNGTVYLNAALQKQIHGKVGVGWIEEQCSILLVDGQPDGLILRPGGVLRLPKLARDIALKGIHLPLTFLMVQIADCQWRGNPLPYAADRVKEGCCYDLEQILLCYADVIQKAVYQVNGIPIEDRYSIAHETVWNVIRTYKREDGPLGPILFNRIKGQLKLEKTTSNRSGDCLSLDADHLVGRGMQPLRIYDLLPSVENVLAMLEEQLMGEQFRQTLTRQERRVFSLLLEDATSEEIAESLGLSREKLRHLYRMILQKYQKFYREDDPSHAQ